MRGLRVVFLVATFLCPTHYAAGQLAKNEPPPKSPAESLACIKVRPGFRVELVAAEPLVQDPIAFAWGPDGKFWVVEMGDYPLGVDGKNKFGGKVKFLEDTDGDGKYDKATVFLDNLGYPTGVMPWRKGVLVTCAPDIIYAEDTDGDGKADKREVLFTGFFPGNQQHRVNTLAWGLDGWVYCANGDSGGLVTSPKRKQGAVNISGRDFRIRPDTGEIDAQTGQTQFGRCRDDWGNWFGGNNSNPLWHFALEDHYLRRNPHVAPPNPRVPVSIQPGVAPVYPISKTLPRFNDWHTANRFTSACSPTIYRDELFGPEFANNWFVCEPVHNLVHREVMTPKGFTFTSRRADDEQKSEFLASSDNWFRPVFVQTGPDGALWVADMYRHVIEHPQWIPDFWQQKLDLRAGHDKGRIYRVYPADKEPRAIPRLDKLDTAGLVAALDSPSGWQRDMVQQMLIWQQDESVVPLLEKQACEHKSPLCRLHSLCTLDGLAALRLEALEDALVDPHEGLQRNAIRLAESMLAKSWRLWRILSFHGHATKGQARMQFAYTLGSWDHEITGFVLAQLILRDGRDPYLLAAALSSVTKKNLEGVARAVADAIVTDHAGQYPSEEVVEKLLRLSVLLDDRKSLAILLHRLTEPNTTRKLSYVAFAALFDVLDGRNLTLAKLGGEEPELQAAVKKVHELIGGIRRWAANPEWVKDGSRITPRHIQEEQLAALRLLGRDPDRRADDLKVLAGLLAPQSPHDMQATAVAALGRLRDPAVPELLLRGWKGHAPALRTQVLDALLPREDGVKAVLDAVEKKHVLPVDFDATRRQRLLGHKSTATRERAAKLFVDSLNPDRQKLIESYRAALTLKGDAARGKPLFTKHCAVCHKFEGQGNDVGPDIGSVGDKSPEGLLIAVLDPNRAVEARYLNYVAETKDGRSLSGVLANETGTSVTLVGSDGKPQVILRTDLEALASTGKSAMPEGLEKDLPPQDLADVFAYVRAGSPALVRKEFKGNKPELVKPEADGSLYLRASNCEIYGPKLVYEPKHQALEWWNHADDHAVWTLGVPRAGRYAVWLEWSCDDKNAGNSFVLQAGTHTFSARVESSGSWDTYRNEKVGTMTLGEGQQRLTMRAEGALKGALIDLKTIRLVRTGG